MKTLLVVDDESSNLALMNQVLSSNYKLCFAKTSQASIEAAIKHRPDLILLDVNLPDRSGIQTCVDMKSNPQLAEIPIIFVTHLNDVVDEEAGLHAGAVDYVSKPISIPILKARIETHLSLVKVSRLERVCKDAISMLGKAGHFNDNDTGVHIWRMASFCKILAEFVGWSADQAELLKHAAPMHDTGKIGIPAEILKKPGKLDQDEWAIMRQHSVIGAEILSESQEPIFQLASEIARYHHEKWDGSGYPEGLAGDAIPASARIVAICDVYDALSMERPYKKPWPQQKIVEYMESQSGQHFDPSILSVFLKNIEVFDKERMRWNVKLAVSEVKPICIAN